ncbi:hypothetical protein [Pontibacter silvestris]
MMIDLLHLKGVESIIQLLKILHILALSTDCSSIAHSEYVKLIKESGTDQMSRVYEHIIKNFKKKVSLEEVVPIANVSLSSFTPTLNSGRTKLFLTSLVNTDRPCLQRLNEEDINIIQMGYDSGFNTLSNFTKQFKDITGCTGASKTAAHIRTLN